MTDSVTARRRIWADFGIRVDADNAKSVWDGSSVVARTPSRLTYVPGSAVMTTADATFKLTDSAFTGTGMPLGQFKQDGEYPVGRAPNGYERAAGFFEFQLRAEPVNVPR